MPQDLQWGPVLHVIDGSSWEYMALLSETE